MVVTYKTIKNIEFPVYEVYSENWDYSDGLLRIDTEIVDDRNQPGSNLGVRRLQTPHKNLYPLKKQLDYRGILKSSTKTFIDTNGKLFHYEKTKFPKLKYHKIKKLTLKEKASTLYLYGVNFPFIIPRPPDSSINYAGVLYLDNLPWILYNYSEEAQKDSRKKV